MRRSCNLKRIGQIRKKIVQNLISVEKNLDEKAEGSVPKFYGQILKLDEKRVVEIVWQCKLPGIRSRVKPRCK